MPRKTKEGMIPYEDIDQKEYHRQYYKKNRDLIKMKRLQAKQTILTEDVKKWKEEKLKDPWALYPFYDPNSKKRYGEDESDTSTIGTPSSSPTSINSSVSL
jgi:superfamily II RNA helicase